MPDKKKGGRGRAAQGRLRKQGGETPTSSSPTDDDAVNPTDGNIDATRAAARGYLERGWTPIAMPHMSKGPRLNKWEDRTRDAVNVDRDFKDDNTNIGIVLGEASGDLVDVDLDCPEAIRLARHFLPDTKTRFGRRSARESHWLYVSPGAVTTPFGRPGEKPLVEIRSKGAQTMFPPSFHPNEEVVRWCDTGDQEPAQVDAADLRRSVATLAFGSLLLRYWQEGSRNRLALCTTGALLGHGWDISEVDELLDAVSTAAGDDEQHKKIWRVIVPKTAGRLERGLKCVGLPSLASELEAPKETLRDWIERRSLAELGAVASRVPIDLARRYGEVHGDLWHWRGDFYEWRQTYWTAITEDDLRARIYLWLEKAVIIEKED